MSGDGHKGRAQAATTADLDAATAASLTRHQQSDVALSQGPGTGAGCAQWPLCRSWGNPWVSLDQGKVQFCGRGFRIALGLGGGCGR